MLQGNNCYRLVASTTYRPGATGATAGPASTEAPITLIYVAPGAATLDFYDSNNNRNIIPIGSSNRIIAIWHNHRILTRWSLR